MTTTEQLTRARHEAESIFTLLRQHLPPDSYWVLNEPFGDDAVYMLTVYADLEDEWPLRELVREYMADLLERGLPIALIFERTPVAAG